MSMSRREQQALKTLEADLAERSLIVGNHLGLDPAASTTALTGALALVALAAARPGREQSIIESIVTALQAHASHRISRQIGTPEGAA